MDIKKVFACSLFEHLKDHFEEETLIQLIEQPKHDHLGDLAFPCFSLAKAYRKAPQLIAMELSQLIQSPLFEKVQAINGYLNVYLKKSEVTNGVLTKILSLKEGYGSSAVGKGGVITFDLSSPNIAKPFSMGHLRSTVIGNALALIAEKCGYQPVKINHLGDWGTQFGKLMAAYEKWGKEEAVKKEPIKELLKLYVKFHEEAKHHPELIEQGREWFKKLEQGDREAEALWKWFKEESLKEFGRLYDLMGITFDSYDGEAFYNDKMDHVVHLLEEKHLLELSEGALVVDLSAEGMPPCLIKKTNGTTLYATRDLAAAIYRYETYHFHQSLYIVGYEQTLHFKQLFAVLEKMGYSWHDRLIHVPFGMILKEGKKMSTRKGKVILLEEVLNEAVDLAYHNITEKNPKLKNKEEVARQIGVGAILFHDLKHFRMKDIEFSLPEMLKFEGDTGPYIQYTHARASSLLRKGEFKEKETVQAFNYESAWSLTKGLLAFPDSVTYSFNTQDPSQLATYLLDLSKAFNKYYSAVRILQEDEESQGKLTLVFAVKTVLKEGLRLLGLQAPDEM
ncbi:MAG TPA: arginine--tRNA ligase [Sporolactobacillaceae bacterium]|nr:arginine--tRNA ligase [Sporolactobacillaceae bacterium]